MARKRQHNNNRHQRKGGGPPPLATKSFTEAIAERRAEPKKEYGKAFVLLEDESLNTFHYLRGAWVPYEKKIAECRLDCQVSMLPQKVNKMTRYEIRAPIN